MQLETNIKFQFSEFQRTKTLNSKIFLGQRQFLGNKFPRWKTFFHKLLRLRKCQVNHYICYYTSDQQTRANIRACARTLARTFWSRIFYVQDILTYQSQGDVVHI